MHELGHFLVGKKLGFGILEFSIGMGPALWKKEKDGVTYALRAFPIGGMCRFEGEDEGDGVTSPTAFNNLAVWKRMLVVVAGPVMNVLFALLFAFVTLVAFGDYMPQIQGFAEGASPAREAGLLEGDVILRVDDTRISYYTDATDAIGAADSAACRVVVDRNGEELGFTVHDIYDAEAGRNMLGVTIAPVRYHFPLGVCVLNSVGYVGDMLAAMGDFLGDLFRGQVQDGDVGGPVMVVNIIGQAVRLGLETLLRMTVLISINLAVVNLLPLPALDGGRLLFMLIELIRGKPLNQNAEGVAHLVGFALLMGLVVFLTYKDIMRLL